MSTTTTPAIRDSAGAELEDWDELEEATGPTMTVTGATLWSAEDGSEAEAGLWQTTAGPSRWTLETNEFVHILSGRMTVTRDGEAPLEVGPGDSVFFPKGWSGTWDVHEPLRKCYVIF